MVSVKERGETETGLTGVATSRAPGNASVLYSSWSISCGESRGRTVFSGLGIILGWVRQRKCLSRGRMAAVAMAVVATTTTVLPMPLSACCHRRSRKPLIAAITTEMK